MAWADIVRRVMDQAPGCPDPTAADHARAAAAEFCGRTRCWRHVVTVAVASEAAAAAVTIVYPDGDWPHGSDAAILARSSIHEIERAWLDDADLTPVEYGALAPQEIAAEGPARFITQVDARTVALAPRQAGQLRLNLYLRPSLEGRRTSLDALLPAHLTDRYASALVSGALRSLLLVPGKSWTAPDIAAAHAAVFERECDRNFDAAHRGQQGAPKRMRARFF